MPIPPLKAHVATVAEMSTSMERGHIEAADFQAEPKIDFIKIDEHITLRRMVSHAADPKGTVLFLHGFPETLAVWKEISVSLAKEYEVHAFDWPGYGQSSRPSPEKFSYSPKDYAEVLKAYIEKAGIDRSTLIIYATDLGGLPALLLALDEPAVAKKIVVGDFAPFNRPQYMSERLQNLKAEPTATPTRAQMNKTSDEILQNIHRRGLSTEAQYDLPSHVQEDMKHCWTRDGLTTVDALASYYSYFTCDEDYLEANLGRLETPVKVIWGEKDIFINKEMGEELADRTGSEFEILQGIGHFPHLQDPTRTVAEVRAAFSN